MSFLIPDYSCVKFSLLFEQTYTPTSIWAFFTSFFDSTSNLLFICVIYPTSAGFSLKSVWTSTAFIWINSLRRSVCTDLKLLLVSPSSEALSFLVVCVVIEYLFFFRCFGICVVYVFTTILIFFLFLCIYPTVGSLFRYLVSAIIIELGHNFGSWLYALTVNHSRFDGPNWTYLRRGCLLHCLLLLLLKLNHLYNGAPASFISTRSRGFFLVYAFLFI